MKNLRVGIVSDVACPWCAIGYKRLELAMAELEPEMTFAIDWHAFQLNPDMPPQGESILEHLTRKYGKSESEMKSAQNQIVSIAQDLGLNFSMARERRAYNTFDAHRLLAWAREQGRQTALKLALFEAYFGHAQDTSDPLVLRKAVESAGLSGDDADAVLATGRFADEVRAEENRFKQAGVTGVPAFIINGRYLISGAQEPQELINAFRQIAAEQAQAAKPGD